MPDFRLRGHRPDKGFTFLSFSAPDAAAARQLAERDGFRVLEIVPVASWSALRKWRQGRAFSLELFCQELLTLLDAGLNLIEALALVARKQRNEHARQIMATLQEQLSRGLSFSRALEAQSEVFPVLFVATVRSSERTGTLTDALERYLAYRLQINAVRDKVAAASIYPALLIAVSTVLLVFLLTYVVPRFSRIYADLGDRVPLASRLMIEWSALLEAHGGLLALAALGSAAASVALLLQPAVRAGVMRVFWRLPGIGERARIYQLARFTRTLAMLHEGGIAFVPALGIVGELLHQPALSEGLTRATRAIAEGGGVSAAFETHGLSTETATRMLAVGERSGELGAMLHKIANMYDQEVERAVEWFSRLLEPILMIAVGLVIGTVILLMYLPIVELANLVQ